MYGGRLFFEANRPGYRAETHGMGHRFMADSGLNAVRPRAQAALANSPFYELRNLSVECRDDAILISGRVTSFYHKQLAQEVVRCVCAEIEVVNAIHVESDANAG